MPKILQDYPGSPRAQTQNPTMPQSPKMPQTPTTLMQQESAKGWETLRCEARSAPSRSWRP